MSDINKMFDAFPDYDVFDKENQEIKPRKKRKHKKKEEFDYIQYDEQKDFRNAEVQEEEDFPEPEHSTDYGDDYGVYRVYEERIKNSASLLYFPFVFIWLEVFLRLGCGQSLLSTSLIYIVLFSIAASGIFMTLFTFFNEKFNRTVIKIFVGILTAFYCIEMVCFNYSQSFYVLGKAVTLEYSLTEFNAIMDIMSDKVVYLLCSFVPFVVFLFVGKYLFPFRKIRIPAKVCLLLVAVLMYFSALTIISFDKKTENPQSNYSVYNDYVDYTEIQERFGLLALEINNFL